MAAQDWSGNILGDGSYRIRDEDWVGLPVAPPPSVAAIPPAEGRAAPSPMAAPALISGQAVAVDGDTLQVSVNGVMVPVRIRGIDAPEAGEIVRGEGGAYRGGDAATRTLAERLVGARVTISPTDIDVYGRIVGDVHRATRTGGGESPPGPGPGETLAPYKPYVYTPPAAQPESTGPTPIGIGFAPRSRRSGSSRVLYNKARGQYWIDGQLYDADDITGLMGRARADLSGPAKHPPLPYTPKGWRNVNPKTFLERSLPIIGERGIGTIASKGFGRGVDILQQLGGRALEATRIPGVADWGWNVAEDQERELAKTQYYATGLGDIESGGDFGRWVVGALAEQAPMILATAGIGWKASVLAKAMHAANVTKGAKAVGAAVKAARAAPDAAPVAQLTAKAAGQAFKGANRYERMGAAFARLSGNKDFARLAQAAAAKRMRGEALDAAEAKVLSQAARITGAGFGLLGAQYGMGVGDVYGEIVESKTPGTTGFGASALAFAAAAPYAAIGATGEGIVARQLLKGVVKPKELTGRLAKTKRRLAQAGKTALLAGAAEGVAEGLQEATVIGSRRAYTGEGEGAEDFKRILEGVATGALVGGVLGGAGGAARRPVAPTQDFVAEAPVAEPEPQPLMLEGPSGPRLLTDQRDPVPAQLLLPDQAPLRGESTPLRLPGRVALPGESVIRLPGEMPPIPLPGTRGIIELPAPPAVARAQARALEYTREIPGWQTPAFPDWPVDQAGRITPRQARAQTAREAKARRVAKGVARVHEVVARAGGPPGMAERILRAPAWNSLVWTKKGEVRANLNTLRQRVETEVASVPEQAGAPPLGAQPAVSPPAQAAPPVTEAATLIEPVERYPFTALGEPVTGGSEEGMTVEERFERGLELDETEIQEQRKVLHKAVEYLEKRRRTPGVSQGEINYLSGMVDTFRRRVALFEKHRIRPPNVAREGPPSRALPQTGKRLPPRWPKLSPRTQTAAERVEGARAALTRDRRAGLVTERMKQRHAARQELDRRLQDGETLEQIWGGERKEHFDANAVVKAVADYDAASRDPDTDRQTLDALKERIGAARQAEIDRDKVSDETKALRYEIVAMERQEQDQRDREWREYVSETEASMREQGESEKAINDMVGRLHKRRGQLEDTNQPFVGRTAEQARKAAAAESERVAKQRRARGEGEAGAVGKAPATLREELGALQRRRAELFEERKQAEEIATGGTEEVVGETEKGEAITRLPQRGEGRPEQDLQGWRNTAFLEQEIDLSPEQMEKVRALQAGKGAKVLTGRQTPAIQEDIKNVEAQIETLEEKIYSARRLTKEAIPKGAFGDRALARFMQASRDRVGWSKAVLDVGLVRAGDEKRGRIRKAAAKVWLAHGWVGKRVQAYKKMRDLGTTGDDPDLRKKLFKSLGKVSDAALDLRHAIGKEIPARGEYKGLTAEQRGILWSKKNVLASLETKPWDRMRTVVVNRPGETQETPSEATALAEGAILEDQTSGYTGADDANVNSQRDVRTSGDILYEDSMAARDQTLTGATPEETMIAEEAIIDRRGLQRVRKIVEVAGGTPDMLIKAASDPDVSKLVVGKDGKVHKDLTKFYEWVREQVAAAKKGPAATKDISGDPKATQGELRLRRDYAKLDGSGTTPTDGVPLGQVKAFVNRRMAKLRNKPGVTVTRDAASLAREAPAVYRAALAEDPDFARKQVHGAFLYVDGKPHAVFFSKFTKSEGQLNYTFAHEVLGHYGLRGVMNRQELKRALAAMEKDLKISAEADRKQATYDGMGREEALEEALADYAADIDTGLLNRIWTILKNALNRLGIEFYDDNARHLVWSARRFTHRGGDRSMRYFRSFTMRDQAVAVEAHGRGMRYARKPNPSLYGMGTVNFDPNGTLREQLNEWWAATSLKDRVVHSWEGAYQKAIGNLMTTNANAERSPLFDLVWKLTNSADREAKQAEARIKKLLERVMNEVRGGPYETELTRATHLLRFHTRDKLEKWLEAGNRLPDAVTIDENGIASIDEKAFDELMELGRVDPSRIAKRERFAFKDAAGVTRYYQVPKKYSAEEAKNIGRWHAQVHNAIRDSARQRLERDIEMFNARANKATEGLSTEKAEAYRKIVGWYRNELRRLTEDGGKGKKQEIDQLGKLRSAVEARLTGNATSYMYRRVPDPDRLELWGKAGDKMRELGIDVPPDPTKEEAEGRAKEAAAANRTISKLSALDTDLHQASDTAAKTLAEGYVPFRRFGMYQVNLIAVDPNTGKRVPNLTNDAVRQLYYSQMESRSAMDREVKRLEDLAKELGTIKLTAYDAQDQIQTVDVKLVVESGTKGEPVFLPDNADFGKMLGILDRAGNAISANAYRKMADLYLSGAALQRNRTLELQRTPGESKDLFRSVSGWAIGNANESAKRKYLPWINEALQDNELAEPSEAELDRRIAEYEAMPAGFEKDTAKRALENFLLQYRFSAPRGRTFTNPFDGKKYETRGRGGYYRNQAVKLRDFVGDPTTIRQSSDNLFRSGLVGKMTTATMVMQLGGSPATAFLNITSIFLNSLPYLSSRNDKTNYGEGHNPIQVAAELTRAGRDMVNPKLADVSYLERLVRNTQDARELRRKHRLTQAQAVFLLEETEKGLLQASLSNEMMGASRGHAKTKARRKALEGWMWMFQHTESFSRRTVALAAYRLERARLKELGVDPTSQAATDAMYEAARRTVSRSQGVYEAYNRPAWARNDLGRMLFTYKQYVITTLQMFMSLNLKGKAMFLGALFLAGGLSELPFAQDIMDFGNSLQAAFGIRSHSIEQHIIDYSDATVPGLGKYMLYGFLNPLVGSNIGQRTGLGDVLPSSGIFRPGTNWGAEATQFLGPVYSAAEGSLALAGATFKQLVEAAGGKPDATSISDVGKTSPIAFIRNTTNAALYMTDGRAIGKNGKTATTNLGPWNAALQVFGFSPWSSAANYLFMKQYRYVLENAKSWREAYVRMAMDAHFDGDQRAVRDVFRDVHDHNRLVRQGGMPAEYEIRNFPRSFREAVRYGGVSAVERAAGGLAKRDRPRYIQAAAAAGAG